MSQLQYDVLFDENVDEKIARIKLTDDKFGGIIYRYDVVSFKEDRNDEATLKFAGLSHDMIRLSVGIEDIDDIKNDFEIGFRAAKKPRLVSNQ